MARAITPRLMWSLRRTPAGRPAATPAIAANPASPDRQPTIQSRQSEQYWGKAGVGKADLLGVVAQYLVGSLDHLPLMLGDSLPTGLSDPVADDELVDLGHAMILQLNLSPMEPWT